MRARQYRFVPLLMWLIPLSFFAFQFILRLWPGLMMQQIMNQFSIDASHFGLLAAFYYYGYSSMQIPVAMLLDRFNPRIIVFSFAVLCGLATLLFTYTTEFSMALISRFFIGVGSSVGFLGVSKIVSEWFSRKNYSRMIGFSFTFGLMGAIYGGKPLSILISTYHWQNIALVLALISISIGCVAVLVLRSPTETSKLSPQKYRLNNFRAILSSKVVWYLAIANLLMVGALEGFADVWGVPYLMKAYDFSKAESAGIISFIFLGMLFGGPLLAFFSKRFGNFTIISAAGLGMSLAFICLLLGVTHNTVMLSSLFFGVGLLCCYQVIVFSAGANIVAPENLGVTVAFLNCINMLGGSFFHTCIGRIMDYFWTGTLNSEGLRTYDLEVYRYALSIIPLCSIIGATLVCYVGIKLFGATKTQSSKQLPAFQEDV